MNDIDTAYLLELSFLAEASIDVQFQAWMAISFAVIVASYSGRASLDNMTRALVAIAYFLAAYALFARWATEANRLIQFNEILLARAVDVTPIFFSGQARLITYIIGTIVTISSVYYFGKSDKSLQTMVKSVEDDA